MNHAQPANPVLISSGSSSPTYGAAVLARIAATHQGAGARIDHDPLITAILVGHGHHAMASQVQDPAHTGRDSGFQPETSSGVAKSWRLAGFLDIHSEFDRIQEYLDMTLGLVVPAHDPKRKEGLVIFHDHCGNDGVQRPLVRLDLVPGIRIEAEISAAVLQADTRVPGHDAGSPHARQAVNKAHGVAVFVDDRQVYRVAAL